jgi:hypothetical protein
VQLQVKSNFRVKYRQFVEQGIDKEIAKFYSKKSHTVSGQPIISSLGVSPTVYRRIGHIKGNTCNVSARV